MSVTGPTSGGGEREEAMAELHKVALDATFTGFFHQNYGFLVRFLTSREADRGMVEDVAQEAFLATRAKWEEVQNYRSPVSWVVRVARNKLNSKQRARMRRPVEFLDDVEAARIAAPADPREAEDLFASWLRMVKPKLAEVMRLTVEGWTAQEIAETLGLSYNTVRSYQTEARDQMEELARQAGLSAPAGRRRR